MRDSEFESDSKFGDEAPVDGWLKDLIPGCVGVEPSTHVADKQWHVDLWAILGGGLGRIGVDVKRRRLGASRYWRNGPEVALESWSVVPCQIRPAGLPGWTMLDGPGLVLFVWDDLPDECRLYSRHLLSRAFRLHPEWGDRYGLHRQRTDGIWESEHVFVPTMVVEQAMVAAMLGRRPR